ncbi:pantoate kinase [Methanocaldococcus fervens]|uniref:Pantoate kinase n=1 Tax=Methanocaldococcus fervens (strain DSM 4213 / JCM 15782 / AG86) TaxID=573064 RepID=C7P7Z2_METFA|nr:pantoate kinase [Methanocaldococcus fervens]ACV24674.1 GHMP kinase [Methanocaldococcus fervens AG86]
MFAPGHITGFFAVCKSKNSLKTGSIGAGITVDKGVSVELKEGDGSVFYNCKKVNICSVEKVLEYYKELRYSGCYDIIFSSDFPLGSGLGMSGGCALTLSKKLNDMLNLNESYVKIAHVSEVECGTGLGDVIAQYTKGFVIRKAPGFPINVEKIHINDDYYIIIEIFGEKETKEIITNESWINRINEYGRRCLNELLKNPTLENFISLSYEFAVNTGLINENILSICDDLKFTVGASQSMLGNTLFCISKKETLEDALSILKNPIVCKIYQ